MTAINIYRQVLDFLKRNGAPDYTAYDDECVITMGMSIDKTLKGGYQRIVCDDFMCIIYSCIRLKADEQSRASVMEYLTRINFTLSYGSFDMDLDDGEIRFRLYLSCIDRDSLSDTLIGTHLEAPQFVFEYYCDELRAVMSGTISPKEALDEFFSIADDAEGEACCCCDHDHDDD